MDNDKFKLITNTKVLVSYINEIVINYPRVEYTLKDRLVNTSYELLRLIYFANVLDNKLIIQKEIIVNISMIDFYLELSYKNKCINLKKLQGLSRRLNEIRKMTYGWIKSNGSQV